MHSLPGAPTPAVVLSINNLPFRPVAPSVPPPFPVHHVPSAPLAALSRSDSITLQIEEVARRVQQEHGRQDSFATSGAPCSDL